MVVGGKSFRKKEIIFLKYLAEVLRMGVRGKIVKVNLMI